MERTLIIGLGGAGVRISANIYKKFMDSHPSEEEREKLICLGFDTDDVVIRKYRKEMPAEWMVKISPDLPIEAIYERLKGRTTIMEWFDNSIPFMMTTLHDGSGMSRMAARIAFLNAEAEGKLTIIDHSIEQLQALNESVQVHIICSLAGGTGSGIFLQTAYYIKEVMHQLGIHHSITGNFILADVFPRDFSPMIRETMYANTYASLKELNAFSSQENTGPLELEYRIHQQELVHDYRPYDMCFMMDTNSIKNQLHQEECYDIVGDFVYHNILAGPTLYWEATSHILRTEYEHKNWLSTFGLAKLVYPVEDLFRYFAIQDMLRLLTLWRYIDQKFEERFSEYKKNVYEGIPDTEPDRGQMFMSMFQMLSHNGGSNSYKFHRLYLRTQVTNNNLIPSHSKAVEHLNAIQKFVKEYVENSKFLRKPYEKCIMPEPDFTNNEEDYYLHFVYEQERALKDFKIAAEHFIEYSKSSIVWECFLKDEESEGYVAEEPEHSKHRLNTFILEKGDEMHPLSFRYFLYDIRENMKKLLNQITPENKCLKEKISHYEKLFDDPKTEDVEENAKDRINQAIENTTFIHRFLKKEPYIKFTEDYLAKSKQQAEHIKEYTCDKLLEVSLSGLLEEINVLIKMVENWFDSLPKFYEGVEKERLWLLKKHDGPQNNIVYVLASEQIKKDLYQYVIRSGSPTMTPPLSASLYRLLYHQAYNVTITKDKKNIRKDFREDYHAVLKECITNIEEMLKENNPNYATKNVISALHEEAMRENNENHNQAWIYMTQKMYKISACAKISYPGLFDPMIRSIKHINSWGLHPECIDTTTITHAEADELFDEIASRRTISEHFSKHKAVRVNTINLLPISHFNKYGNAYKRMIEQRLLMPLHIDKRWQDLLPDI